MCVYFFFLKRKTAYEMRISDWSSDVCSSDLCLIVVSRCGERDFRRSQGEEHQRKRQGWDGCRPAVQCQAPCQYAQKEEQQDLRSQQDQQLRSEEHTSELQSLMRISYAVFCLKKKNTQNTVQNHNDTRIQIIN